MELFFYAFDNITEVLMFALHLKMSHMHRLTDAGKICAWESMNGGTYSELKNDIVQISALKNAYHRLCSQAYLG